MKTKFVLLLAGLWIAVGASRVVGQQEFADLIVGKWQVDVEKSRAFYQERSLTTENDDAFMDQIKSMAIEFTAEGLISVRDAETELTRGEWKLVKEEDAVFHLQFIREDEATPATVEILDSGTIAVAPQNERPLVLVRANRADLKGVAVKLIGTWKQDPEASKAVEANKSYSQEEVDRMLTDTREMVLVFNADQSLVAKMKEGVERDVQAQWKASQVDDAKKSLRLDVSGDGVERVVQVVFLDDDHVCLTPEGEPAAVFARQPAASDK